jgi:hypothetical protein
MDFQDNIKQWVTFDNQEKKLKEQLKLLRDNKNYLSDKIFTFTEDNNMNHAIIEISDGKLKFQNTKTTSPLTFKLLEKCLLEKLNNEELVKELIKHVKTSREPKFLNEIKRTYV